MPYRNKSLDGLSNYRSLERFAYNNRFSIDQHKEALKKVFDIPPFSLSRLEKHIRKIHPNYALNQVDRSKEGMAHRAALSQKAQEVMLDTFLTSQHFLASKTSDVPLPGTNLEDPWNHFVRLSADPADQGFNRMLEMTIHEDGAGKLADFIFREIQQCAKNAGINTPADIYTLPDLPEEDMIDKFPHIKRFATLMKPIEALLNNNTLNFTGEQARQLQALCAPAADLDAIFTARMDMISNPLYKELGDNFFLNHNMETLPFYINTKQNEEGFPSKVIDYLATAGICNTYRGNLLEKAFRQKYPELKDAAFSSIGKKAAGAFGTMTPLVAVTPDNRMHVLMPGHPETVMDNSEYLSQLSAAAVKTGRRLFTGSTEFSVMEKALQEMTAYCRNTPTPDLEKLEELNHALQEAAEAYLTYKDVPNPYNPASVTNRGKNHREQTRMDLASSILQFSLQQRSALDLKKESFITFDDEAAAQVQNGQSLTGLKPSREFSIDDPDTRFTGNTQAFIDSVYEKDDSFNPLDVNPEPTPPKAEWEIALQVNTESAQNRLALYSSGMIKPDDMVGTNATSHYIDQIPSDIAALAFNEALTIENFATNGNGVFQNLLKTKGYDKAFAQFSALITDPNTLSAAGLKSKEPRDIDQFLHQNGPKKLAKDLLQPKTAKKEQKPHVHQPTSKLSKTVNAKAPNRGF